jgi:hypothetical protein
VTTTGDVCKEYFSYIFRRFRKIMSSDYELHHVRPSLCPSTRKSAPSAQILMKFSM